jgi:hypothetical protein
MPLSQAQLAPVDPVLTEHAQRIAPTGFIADQLAPPLTGKAESGQIQIWDRQNLQIPDDSYRAVGVEASYARSPEPSYVSYTTSAHARKILITQRELDKVSRSGGDPSKLVFSRTRAITEQLLLEKEYTLATKATTAANYDTNHSSAIGAGSEWDTASGDPIANLFTAINQIEDQGIFPNVAAMDIKVWRALQRHSDLLDIFKYTSGGRITPEQFLNFFGLRPLISRVKYYTGSAMAAMWGDNCIVASVPNVSPDMNPPESDVAYARSVEAEPMTVRTIDAPELDHKGAYWVECQHIYTPEWFTIDNTTDLDSIGGYLLTNCLA